MTASGVRVSTLNSSGTPPVPRPPAPPSRTAHGQNRTALYLRWSLILLFMIVKAGLIVAVFMHMAWERLALVYAILVPPVAVLVFVAIMVFESDHTLLTRLAFLQAGP